MPRGSKEGLLTMLAILACVEKLCAIMNLVSVERDWVRWSFTCASDWWLSSLEQIVVITGRNEKSLRSTI